MDEFHSDPNKITFDKAEELVDRYIRLYEDQRTRVSSKDVAKKFEIDDSLHNLKRLNSALNDRLELTQIQDARQYRLETDEKRNGEGGR